MTASWITEGTAHRTRVSRDPVRHLLVDYGGEWVLWCSSGKGRPDHNPHSGKFCRECVNLAREAIADDTLDPRDVSGWPVTGNTTAPAAGISERELELDRRDVDESDGLTGVHAVMSQFARWDREDRGRP